MSSDYHCWHQQGAEHLLKNLDFWDILDINLQNGPCLERCFAFCQCQLFVLNQHSTNGRLTWRTLTPFAIVEVLQPQEHCTFCCSLPCDNSRKIYEVFSVETNVHEWHCCNFIILNQKMLNSNKIKLPVLHSCHQFCFVFELHLTIQVRMGRSGQTWASVHVE